jgi:DNA polymerase III subunit epsilon
MTERVATAADERALEALAEELEASGAYRVLRAVPRPPRLSELPPGARIGVYLDLETTGLSPATDGIIEIGLVRFAYDAQGVLGSLDDLAAFQDPGRPIPREVTAITGITDEMVAGRSIPEERVRELIDGAHLVMAHNAAFDRPFAERAYPWLADFPWACSWRDVAWREVGGFEGAGLSYLLMAHGYFFEGHRAVEDCYAGVHLLAQPFAGTDTTVMTHMRECARRTDVRLWAVRSPFETKDLLRVRGYRWNPDAKVWWRDVPTPELDAEKAWLRVEVYGGRLPTLPEQPLDARVRYSARLPDAPG